MAMDINPYRELDANISSTDFEIFCLNTLKAYADREGLKDFSIKHNQKLKADDGTYQIDAVAEYLSLIHILIISERFIIPLWKEAHSERNHPDGKVIFIPNCISLRSR